MDGMLHQLNVFVQICLLFPNSVFSFLNVLRVLHNQNIRCRFVPPVTFV